MKNKIKQLEWDSEFFGKNVYSLTSSSSALVASSLKSLPINSLLYIFSDSNILDYEHSLMDKKVTFELALSVIDAAAGSEECAFYSQKQFTRSDLEILAIEASKFSRFRIDTAISSFKVDELYKRWVSKVLNNISSYEIIGIERDHKLAGSITVDISTQNHHIELISVLPDYQRQGIGRKLISECLLLAKKNGAQKVSVVTQLNNNEACSLYSSCGFKKTDIKYVYHLHK